MIKEDVKEEDSVHRAGHSLWVELNGHDGLGLVYQTFVSTIVLVYKQLLHI